MSTGKEMTVSEMGRKGGKTSSANMTKRQRVERARKAAKAMWEKKKAKEKQ